MDLGTFKLGHVYQICSSDLPKGLCDLHPYGVLLEIKEIIKKRANQPDSILVTVVENSLEFSKAELVIAIDSISLYFRIGEKGIRSGFPLRQAC